MLNRDVFWPSIPSRLNIQRRKSLPRWTSTDLSENSAKKHNLGKCHFRWERYAEVSYSSEQNENKYNDISFSCFIKGILLQRCQVGLALILKWEDTWMLNHKIQLDFEAALARLQLRVGSQLKASIKIPVSIHWHWHIHASITNLPSFEKMRKPGGKLWVKNVWAQLTGPAANHCNCCFSRFFQKIIIQ